MAIFIDIHKPVDAERLEKIASKLTPIDMNFINLTKDNVPFAPGLIIPITESILKDKPKFRQLLSGKLSNLEKTTNKKFGSSESPLLIRICLSNALNDKLEITLKYMGLTHRLISSISETEKQVKLFEIFNQYIEDYSEKVLHQPIASEFTDSKEKNQDYLNNGFSSFKADPKRQLESALLNIAKHQLDNIPEQAQAGSIIIQVMELEIINPVQYFENVCLRNLHSGELIEGGIDGSPQIEELKLLTEINSKLERYFVDICTLEFFSNQKGIQLLSADMAANRTVKAKLNLLCSLFKNERIDAKQLVTGLNRPELRNLLLPIINESSIREMEVIKCGIAGAPGAASGKVFFSTKTLLEYYWEQKPQGKSAQVILLKSATYGEDVQAIELGQGVISSEGGYASHAPVVARCLGKPAIIIPDIKFHEGYVEIGESKINEGDYLTIDTSNYAEPQIYIGKAQLEKPDLNHENLKTFLKATKTFIPKTKVLINADTPAEAEMGINLGADGIGLCRTEHMLLSEDRLKLFQSLIIAENLEERNVALEKIYPKLESDFSALYKILNGLPITIRLLDAPLHEFVPKDQDKMEESVNFIINLYPQLTKDEILRRFNRLEEVNPMLGHRGCRIGISFPEIYEMQIKAILNAGFNTYNEHKLKSHIKIMIPFVMSERELNIIKNGKSAHGRKVKGIKGITRELLEQQKRKHLPFDLKVGVMIELPAAAKNARELAKYAEFFSFGSNDLTQTVMGISRDDINSFLPSYTEADVLDNDPFQKLAGPVKDTIKEATYFGKLIRPDLEIGLCGEQTRTPDDIKFYLDQNFNSVSSSPLNIPLVIQNMALHTLEN
jgi:pyruvate, orthophosphate dikinase